MLHRFRKQESIPNHSRRWLGKSRVWGRRVAARPSGNYPPTFRHKSHKSHVCFQQSAHIEAKEPCIPSRKSPLLPINNKPHGHVRFLYLQMYLSMHLCIYVSMRVCEQVCMHVSMHLRACLCTHLFMYLCIYVHTCKYQHLGHTN